jgi:hypothetical protein
VGEHGQEHGLVSPQVLAGLARQDVRRQGTGWWPGWELGPGRDMGTPRETEAAASVARGEWDSGVRG